MPRKSPEERAAAMYRSGPTARPPAGMSTLAKRHWRQIVAAKPADWFDAGSLPLLAAHCEVMARCDEVSRQLRTVKPGSPEFSRLLRDLKTVSAIVATGARQLRLTVQHSVDPPSWGGKGDESGAGDDVEHDLIGGQAVWPRRIRVVE